MKLGLTAKLLLTMNRRLRAEVIERRQTEEALRHSTEFLEMAQSAGGIGIFDMDLRTGRIDGSPLFFELLGLQAQDLKISRDQWLATVHPDDLELVAHDFQQAVTNGARYIVEYRSVRPDGTVLWIEGSGRVISDDGGKATRVVGTMVDISRRKRIETDLVEATRSAEAANHAKSDFLANMSHEIRTPMNGVIGMTELLLDTELTSMQRESIETIRSSGLALLSLINDILDVSKIEAGRMELEHIDFGLHGVVAEIASALGVHAANKGLELITHIHPEVPRQLRGDPAKLRQILVNLVGNAVKFTPEGEIAVEVGLEETADKKSRDGTALLRFSVTDTGIGIPDEKHARIFEAFAQADGSTTRQYGGTGLGLSIVKRLAQMMGGTVGVSSEPGKGSTFWFTARFDSNADLSVVRTEEIDKRRRQRVLVVDDSAASRRVLTAQLVAHGYPAEAAADAREVPALLQRSRKEGKPFSIVLIDELMPGCDGQSLATAIVEASPGRKPPRLVLLSLIGTPHDPQLLERQGFSACITKPIRENDLVSVLDTILTTDTFLATTRVELRRDPRAPTIGSVLLVEDNPVNQRVARHHLEKLGLKVAIAGNGREAIEAWERDRYDLILMDCQMPEVDGYEATREIRRREQPDRHIPIVALTANALKGDREQCLTAGMDDHLAKPLELEKLRACVMRHLQKPAAPVTAHQARSEEGADPSGTSEQTPVDLPALREMAGGDSEFERELIDTFIDSGDTTLNRILEGLAGNDLPAVRRAAHSLKGASANLRAVPLSSAARVLESLATNEDRGACEAAARKVREEYERTTTFLRSVASC